MRRILRANTQFKVVFAIKTEAGRGPDSPVKYFATPPSGKPRSPAVAKIGPNSAHIQWRRPAKVARGVDIDLYVWSLTLGGVEVDKGEVADHGLEATLEKLLPAETYEFSVKAKSSKNKVKLVSFFLLIFFRKSDEISWEICTF